MICTLRTQSDILHILGGFSLSFVCKTSTQSGKKDGVFLLLLQSLFRNIKQYLVLNHHFSRLLFLLRSFVFALVSDAPLSLTLISHWSGDEINTPGTILGLRVILNMHKLPPRLATPLWSPPLCLLHLLSPALLLHRCVLVTATRKHTHTHTRSAVHSQLWALITASNKLLWVFHLHPLFIYFFPVVKKKMDWSAVVLLINLLGFLFKKKKKEEEKG